jgi:hypothetical protein
MTERYWLVYAKYIIHLVLKYGDITWRLDPPRNMYLCTF